MPDITGRKCYALGARFEHKNIIVEVNAWNRTQTYYCPSCGWEQTVTEHEFYSENITWTIPTRCWNYKKRWEGKWEGED